MAYKCAHCGKVVTDTYKQTKVLRMLDSECPFCGGPFKVKEDFVRD